MEGLGKIMVEFLLEAKSVSKILDSPRPVTLIDNVDFKLGQGEFVAITGPSGSGKSSLMYLLGLLDSPTKGEIYIKGQPTKRMNEIERANHRLAEIGFVFQFHFLLPEFTALENVILPMKKLGLLTLSEMENRGRQLLDKLGLGSEISKTPKQLSGGQSQRVAIARALANDPPVILADEPTGNLDTKSSENVQKILREISSRESRAVLTVTHDKDFAKHADRIVTLVDGRII